MDLINDLIEGTYMYPCLNVLESPQVGKREEGGEK
jgi:hypothetical protein